MTTIRPAFDENRAVATVRLAGAAAAWGRNDRLPRRVERLRSCGDRNEFSESK
jgi:hypothetical protein